MADDFHDDEEIKRKKFEEWGKNAIHQYEYAAFWRPVIGGFLFGIGGSVVIIAAVFGWTYHILNEGMITFFMGVLIGTIMLYIGIGLTS